jgi:hypothetical protein
MEKKQSFTSSEISPHCRRAERRLSHSCSCTAQWYLREGSAVKISTGIEMLVDIKIYQQQVRKPRCSTGVLPLVCASLQSIDLHFVSFSFAYTPAGSPNFCREYHRKDNDARMRRYDRLRETPPPAAKGKRSGESAACRAPCNRLRC